jgi:Protein of unknown function (DUF1003)
VEKYPFGLLTMIVSLEAIFLSTFVMISQNRADAERQVIADQQWRTVQDEDQQNDELLDLSRQILQLTKEVRALTAQRHPCSGSAPDSGDNPYAAAIDARARVGDGAAMVAGGHRDRITPERLRGVHRRLVRPPVARPCPGSDRPACGLPNEYLMARPASLVVHRVHLIASEMVGWVPHSGTGSTLSCVSMLRMSSANHPWVMRPWLTV